LVVEVTIEEAKRIMFKLYKSGSRDSYLLLGDKGVGKSEGMCQLSLYLATYLGKEWIWYSDDVADKILQNPDRYFVFHKFSLFECDSSELLGIPRDKGDAVFYKPLLWARVCNKCACMVFLDDFTNIMEFDKRSASLRILLEKRVGFLPLHKDSIVVCAGNLPEQSSLASYLPSANIDRVTIFNIKAPTIQEWKHYMEVHYQDRWDKKVYEFLSKYPQYMLEESEPETLRQFATPRSWTKLALRLYELKGEPDFVKLILSLVAGIVGETAMQKFMIFYTKDDLITLDVINEDVDIWNHITADQKHMILEELMGKSLVDIPQYFKLLEFLITYDRESFMKYYSSLKDKKKFLQIVHSYRHGLFTKIKELMSNVDL
jgi:hypothetical protein